MRSENRVTGSLDGAPPACAVVVNWNGWHDTQVCVDSLLAQDVPLSVVICDNSSTDGSACHLQEFLDRRLPGWHRTTASSGLSWRPPVKTISGGAVSLQLLVLPRNMGYAGALNAGIRWAQTHLLARRFWLLNNDLEAAPNALRLLQAAYAAAPGAGICGSVLMDWDSPGEVQAVAGAFNRWLGVGTHIRSLPTGEIYSAPDYPVGASMYVEQEYLDRVGFMDESYFLYCEEMDWAERGRRQGLKPLIALGSRLRHKEGASTGSRGGVRHKSLLSEHYGVVNRLRITLKFWPARLPVVWLSLWAVVGDRLLHGEFRRASLVVRLMLTPWAWGLFGSSGRPLRPDDSPA